MFDLVEFSKQCQSLADTWHSKGRGKKRARQGSSPQTQSKRRLQPMAGQNPEPGSQGTLVINGDPQILSAIGRAFENSGAEVGTDYNVYIS